MDYVPSLLIAASQLRHGWPLYLKRLKQKQKKNLNFCLHKTFLSVLLQLYFGQLGIDRQTMHMHACMPARAAPVATVIVSTGSLVTHTQQNAPKPSMDGRDGRRAWTGRLSRPGRRRPMMMRSIHGQFRTPPVVTYTRHARSNRSLQRGPTNLDAPIGRVRVMATPRGGVCHYSYTVALGF